VELHLGHGRAKLESLRERNCVFMYVDK
jgi:hypothetical protein